MNPNTKIETLKPFRQELAYLYRVINNWCIRGCISWNLLSLFYICWSLNDFDIIFSFSTINNVLLVLPSSYTHISYTGYCKIQDSKVLFLYHIPKLYQNWIVCGIRNFPMLRQF